MRNTDSKEHSSQARRGALALPRSPQQPDLQTLLAAAYLREQKHRIDAEADLAKGNEKFTCAVAVQRSVAERQVSPTPEFIAERALVITCADGAAVAVADEANEFVCRGRAGRLAPAVGTKISSSSRFSAECLHSRQVLCCGDAESDERVDRTVCRDLGIRSILAVPIRYGEALVGIIEVFSPARSRFGIADMSALELLAALMADEYAAHPPASPVIVVATPSCDTVTAAPSPATMQTEPEFPAPLALTTATQSVRSRRPLWVMLWVGIAACLAVTSMVSVRKESAPPRAKASVQPVTAPLVRAGDEDSVVPPGPADLTGIKFHSQSGFTTVMMELTGPVRYHADRLTNPNRIVVDLADTHFALKPAGKPGKKTVLVGDKFVARIRVAQKEPNVTRLVLDLNCSCDYMPVLSRKPPFALAVMVQPNATQAHHTASNGRPGLSRDEADRESAKLPPRQQTARGLTIVIDPGHGGSDKGTVGPSGLQEKDLVLEIAQRLGRLVKEKLGADVVFTRTDDNFVPLEARSALANSVNADLFVSIHGNSSSHRSVRGIETFYLDGSQAPANVAQPASAKAVASRRLALAIQHALYTRLVQSDSGMRDRGIKTAPLLVLMGPKMPSILIEISFLSSPAEEHNLMDAAHRDQIAGALYDGISAYLARNNQAAISAGVWSGVSGGGPGID